MSKIHIRTTPSLKAEMVITLSVVAVFVVVVVVVIVVIVFEGDARQSVEPGSKLLPSDGTFWMSAMSHRHP